MFGSRKISSKETVAVDKKDLLKLKEELKCREEFEDCISNNYVDLCNLVKEILDKHKI